MGITAAGVAAAATVASAGASIIGGSGQSQANQQAAQSGQQAADYRQQAADLWNSLQQPVVNKTPLVGQNWLQDYTPVNYTPTTGQFYQSSDDPTSIANENLALSQMQALARGGLQPADLINLKQIQGAQAAAASSQSASAQDQLRARGLGGAGADEAAMLYANQGAANSTSSLYNNALQQAMARQTAAIQAAGNYASGIRGQDNSISQQMASNNNAFNSQAIAIQNAAAIAAMNNSNQAQAANLAGRQGVANSNSTTANANVALQNAQAQQAFNNQTTQITGQTNALNGQSTLASAQQAASALQAQGSQQSLTAGLNGLAGLAKTATPTPSPTSSSPGWFSSLFGSNTPNTTTTAIDPATGQTYQTSTNPNDNF